MTAPPISDQLADWARVNGFALTPNSSTGAALFSSEPGGEVRYYLRVAPDGGYILTSAERASTEQFEFYTKSMSVMERHLMVWFGRLYRSRHQLQRLPTFRTQDDLAPGYTIVAGDPEGSFELRDRSGALIARAHGKLSSISTFVRLSHLLESSLSDIRRSYESPDGSPLFGVQ